MSALRMSIDRRRPEPGLIHHSDRGIQYMSEDYRNQLDENGIIASMSRKGNCYDSKRPAEYPCINIDSP